MHYRRFIAAALAGLAVVAQVSFAAPKTAGPKSERFYGKITNINSTQGGITVHNTKKNQDATFQMDGETRVTHNKTSISPRELKVGQSLVVYYVSENDIARARRITVRPDKIQ